jgi:hypothetical protein
VEKIDRKFNDLLDEFGLGLPILETVTVSEIIKNLMTYQGNFIEGDLIGNLLTILGVILSLSPGRFNLEGRGNATLERRNSFENVQSSRVLVDTNHNQSSRFLIDHNQSSRSIIDLNLSSRFIEHKSSSSRFIEHKSSSRFLEL